MSRCSRSQFADGVETDPRKGKNKGPTIIHVNRHVIADNKKHGEQSPPLTVKYGKKGFLGRCVVIRDDGGQELARLVYRPDDPLKCGATVWAESRCNVEVYEHEPNAE